MRNSKWLILLVIVVVIFVVFLGTRYISYGATASAYTPPEHALSNVSLESIDTAPRLETVDEPTVSEGVVVIDFAHRNALYPEELNILLSKIVSRGYSYELLLPTDEDEEGADSQTLIDKLRYADTLILPLPRTLYTDEEINEIERFVENGGKILIIGDPTRTVDVTGLNSVSAPFNIIYVNDYLYSLDADTNDNNYRNVAYSNFADSPVTEGLSTEAKVVFYSGSSVSAPGYEIIFGNDNTFSSISESGRQMAAAALSANDQVMALTDLTFLSEPYSAVESNGTFINNVADLLTSGERTFELKDFPYFLNNDVDVVFDDSLVFNSQFEDSVKLKDFLESTERTVNFTNEISGKNDVIFIGRFDQIEAVEEYLAAENIYLIPEVEELELVPAEMLAEDEDNDDEALEEEEDDEEEAFAHVSAEEPDKDADQDFVEGRIEIEGVGELEMGGSTLYSLHKDGDRNIIVILSDNPDTNADAFELLLSNEFAECTASATVAVCQTEEPDKADLPSVRSTRVDKILVVSDDDGRTREEEKTSFAEYNSVLSSTYKISVWSTTDDGPLNLAELQEYDAVIWTTGDYWDDSIGSEDVELLTKYIEAGGNLVLSGASIGFDWDHTDFLTNIAHADYLTFAEQTDIEAVVEDHPLAKGFTAGDTITFVESDLEEPLAIDVLNHTHDARVIFQRGADSEQAGAASVIAFEDDRAKVAYFAFPIYLLPAEEQAILLDNTIDWFTRRPLDIPDEGDYEPFEAESDSDDDTSDAEDESEEDDEETSDEESIDEEPSDEEDSESTDEDAG